MRIVNAHILQEKIDEAVDHYISSHPPGEQVHIDGNSLSLNVQDEAGRVVTVMPGQGYPSQISRQVPVSEAVEGGPWNEELLDPEMRLAALVAHLAHQSRTSHNQTSTHPKTSSARGDVDSSVILDASLKLFSGQSLDSQSESIVVQVPSLPPLPPLQGICSRKNQETDWFHNKDKGMLKGDGEILAESEPPMIELSAGASPAHIKQQNKKSLPHKKRISRKLKRNTGNSTPQQDIVVINCTDEVPQEEILPDNFVNAVQHQEHLTEETHHITQEMRAILICQLCGDFYGEEQLKFYQHLKQHYEPHATIIIENPVTDLAIDKMTNTCIVDNGATLPDSIVELSLESTVPKTMYQPPEKHILYTSSDKTLYTNRVQYSMASMDKEPVVPTSEAEKTDIYDTLEKLGMYSCIKCNKQFRKQKQCEAHIKEAHSNTKLEDMGEFSEPEDLMEGIHVTVEEGTDQYEQTLLPHLTVENGQVHQEHVRHWYFRSSVGGGGALAACGADGAYCPVCPACPAPPAPPAPPPLAALAAPPTAAPTVAPPVATSPRATQTHPQLKEEVLQRIFESEVPSEQDHFPDNIIQEQEIPAEPEPPPQDIKVEHPDKKKLKKCECPQCGRVFFHRNSLLYHILSHRGKQHECKDCGKGFYTTNALKVHVRVHNGDRPYKCEVCGREFRQWSDLKYHKISLHSNQKHFKCEYCGKEFARKYSLNVHRRIHTGEKNYKCDYCNKTFRASSYRLSHMRTHTGDRPYKCTSCEKGFRVAGDLRRHMLIHERVRNRLDEHKKPKDEKPKKNQPKTEVKSEPKDDTHTAPKLKKIAVASTTRPPLLKSVDKKQKPKKTPIKKVGAPNVTVVPNSNREQFKINTDYADNVEVFDTRQDYTKFKEVYSESNTEYIKDYKGKEYNAQMIGYKGGEQERELAILKPIYRNGVSSETEKPVVYRAENTDGKMQVFTHVEKPGSLVSNTLGDIRGLERDRSDLHGEVIENGFLENLTALYNIPAV